MSQCSQLLFYFLIDRLDNYPHPKISAVIVALPIWSLCKLIHFLVYFAIMKRFSCVIFDLDGTLSRTNELIFATFNHVTEKYLGRQYTPAEITAMFGPPEEVAIEHLVGAERADEAMRDFFEYYEGHHATMASAYDGVPELLRYLDTQGVVLALFTGKGKRSTLITLEQLGIRNLFDLVVSGSDVVNHKPSAEGIRRVIRFFGLGLDEVLMVGDSVADIKASHEAGVTVASVVWDSYSRERVLAMNADLVFHTVAEFSSWIKTMIADGNGRQHA